MGRVHVLGCVAWLCLVACKASPLAEESSSTQPQIGYSATKKQPPLDAAKAPTSGDAATGDAATGGAATVGDAAASGDAAEARDARPRIGGNGSPPYRNQNGEVHGPGGPVFMGHGPPCDLAHDHCLRPDVWFSVGNIVPGKLYRAVPVFEFEDVWYDWRGREVAPVKLYKTKAAGDSKIRAGVGVIVFSSETASRSMWVDSEHEALTSSRWIAGVTEAASRGNKVRIKGWDEVPVETVRLIVAKRAP